MPAIENIEGMITFEPMLVHFLTGAWHRFFKLFVTIFLNVISFVRNTRMKLGFIVFLCMALCLFAEAQDLVSQKKPEIIFNTGFDLMAHGEYGAAREDFTRYLALSSTNDLKRKEAEYYKAFCSVKLYHADGEKQLENFIATNPVHPLSVTAYYDLATFFYDEKNYSKASSYFARTDFPLLVNEQQNTGHFRWGYALFNQRKLKEAQEQFSFVKSQDGQYGPAANYYAGFIEYSQGDYHSAAIDLKRAEQNSAYANVVPYVLANVYYKQKSYDELLRYTASIKGREGVMNSEEIALLSAEAYYKKNDFIKALSGYNEYLEEKESVDKGVLLRAGYSAYMTGNNDRALSYLKRAASDQDSVGYYASYYLGSLYLKLQQKPLAAIAYGNARNFKGDARMAEESSFQFAKISYDLARSDQAIDEFEKFQKTYPNSSHNVEVRELLGHAYVNANNYNRAIEYIESLPRHSASTDQAYQKATYLKGAELFNKEEYFQAVQFFEKSLQFPIDPLYVADASFWCGEAYSIGKKYDKAAENYNRIIGLSGINDPELIAKTRYGLGYCYFNQQQYDRALFNFKEFVNKASKENNNLPDGILRLADCYYVSKLYPEALANYRKAIDAKTSDGDYAHLQTGIILGIQRSYAEASSQLEQVIKNYPESRFADEALFQRGQLLFEQGNYSNASSEFTRLINSYPSSRFLPYAYMRRAASYYNLKDFNKTSADYITVVDKYSGHPVANDVLLPLQEALNLAGRSAEFEQYLSKFKSANPDAKGIESVEFETAKNLYFNQTYDKAIASLGNYVINYPNSPRLSEAKYYRAESYYRLKDYSKALAIYYELAPEEGFIMANKVSGRVAEIEFKMGAYEKAIPYFHKLARAATNKKDQYTAWSGLMESNYLLAQYDSTDKYAHLILEKGNVNAGAQNKASLYLGKSAMGRGDYETAKDEFLNTLNTAQDEYGAEAKYLIGEIFFFNKEYNQCYETLLGLNKDFSAYTDWVGKSFLLLSDNFYAQGNTFQSKATLKSLLADFPLAYIKDQAAEKLKKIEAEENKKKAVVDTSGN
jgi:TolA-binding protein